MKQKRNLAIALAAILAFSSLTACGSDSDSSSSKKDKASKSSSSEISDDADNSSDESSAEKKNAKKKSKSKDKEESSEDASSTEDSSKKKSSKKSTEEASVLFEDATAKITYTGLEESTFGADMKVTIENLSDKNITVNTRDVSVNGIMSDPIFSVDVAAGKKANDTITFYDLEDKGIDEIGEIELGFHVYDSDSWDTIVDTPLAAVVIDDSVTTTPVEGTVVYEKDNIKISYIGKELSDYTNDFSFLIENETGKTITVQAENVSIDGVMYDPIFSADVKSGAIANDAISFWDDDFPKTQKEMELTFHICDTESWDTILDTDPITIDVSK